MSSSQRLHPTAEAVYRFIVRFKRQYAGESPTRREIGAGVGISTPSIVSHHLDMLERAGRIWRPKRGKARMIAIPGSHWEFDELVGQQAAAPDDGGVITPIVTESG